jgi:hypothetical protein
MDRYNICDTNGVKKLEVAYPVITDEEMDNFVTTYTMYTDITDLWGKYVIDIITPFSFEGPEKLQYYIDTYEDLAIKTALKRLEDNKITNRRQVHIYLSLIKFSIETKKMNIQNKDIQRIIYI